tara:strand:- start:9675 stop:11282 length:1608 start_codon:yes stop_codon:yes gene_type:complete
MSDRDQLDQDAYTTVQITAEPEVKSTIVRSIQKLREGNWKALSLTFLSEIRNEYGIDFGWLERAPYFVHVSELDKSKLAYYPTVKHLETDRVVSVRAGKLFRRALSEGWKDDVVADITNRYLTTVSVSKVQWARTADEIEHVYVTGPRSCMGGRGDDDECIRTHEHPSRVYATDDIAVAYVQSESGKINSRCVVNVKEKYYSVFYGNTTHLRSLLIAQGYTEGDLCGCRVKKIKDRGAYVMPYIDNCEYLTSYDKDHFLIRAEDNSIDNDDDIIGYPNKTSGFLDEVEECAMPNCEDLSSAAGGNVYLAGTGHVCNGCASRLDLVHANGDLSTLHRKEDCKWLPAEDMWYTPASVELVEIEGEEYRKNTIIRYGFYLDIDDNPTKTNFVHKVGNYYSVLDHAQKQDVHNIRYYNLIRPCYNKIMEKLDNTEEAIALVNTYKYYIDEYMTKSLQIPTYVMRNMMSDLSGGHSHVSSGNVKFLFSLQISEEDVTLFVDKVNKAVALRDKWLSDTVPDTRSSGEAGGYFMSNLSLRTV